MGKYVRNPKYYMIFVPGVGRVVDQVVEGSFDHLDILVPYKEPEKPKVEEKTELIDSGNPWPKPPPLADETKEDAQKKRGRPAAKKE